MAKDKAIAVKEETPTTVALIGDRGLAPLNFGGEDFTEEEIRAYIEEHGGEGISTKQEDKVVPILRVLQDNSPQVKRQHPDQIEGAQSGDLLLTSLKKVFPADQGVLFQPCEYDAEYVEWPIRTDEGGGGAPVARYREMPKTARRVPKPQNPKVDMFVMPSGNTEIIFTRSFYGHVITPEGLLQAVLPLSSTGHQFARMWTTYMDNLRWPGTSKPMPARFRAYRLTPKLRQKGTQSWWVLDFEDMGRIGDKTVIERGGQLREAVLAGLKEADYGDRSEVESVKDDDSIPF